MILYAVKYRKPHWPFWITIKKVQADGFMVELGSRYFMLEDNSRVEIPGDFLFKFSKERHQLIQQIQGGQAEEGEEKPKNGDPHLTLVK